MGNPHTINFKRRSSRLKDLTLWTPKGEAKREKEAFDVDAREVAAVLSKRTRGGSRVLVRGALSPKFAQKLGFSFKIT